MNAYDALQMIEFQVQDAYDIVPELKDAIDVLRQCMDALKPFNAIAYHLVGRGLADDYAEDITTVKQLITPHTILAARDALEGESLCQ